MWDLAISGKDFSSKKPQKNIKISKKQRLTVLAGKVASDLFSPGHIGAKDDLEKAKEFAYYLVFDEGLGKRHGEDS